MLLDEEAVVLLGQAAEELESHDEEDDTDAGTREHALGLDLPGLGDEAGVNDVPVPEHLVDVVSSCCSSHRMKESYRNLACASHAHHVAHGAVHGAASGAGASSRGARGHTHIHDG